ncbi:MAG: hypothetical protein RRA94_08360, partial [Bacteroidota bacterium]|nr:hypothetical protein [Bacteroidota bacterium]
MPSTGLPFPALPSTWWYALRPLQCLPAYGLLFLVICGFCAQAHAHPSSPAGSPPLTNTILDSPGEHAQNRADRLLASLDIRFQENRGQFVDAKGGVRNEILYTARVPGAQLYVRPDGISTVFTRVTPEGELHDRNGAREKRPVAHRSRGEKRETHRVDMTLVGCNPAAVIRADARVDGVVNFYADRFPEGLLGVREFRRIVYEEIYQHIDLELLTVDGRVKYNFIVRPGGCAKDIRMRYEHADDVSVHADGSLVITTPLGSMQEDAPLCWTGEDERPVAARFVVDDRTIRFAVSGYDSARTLIIDPWATYYGGSEWDFGHDIVVDAANNLYVAGAAGSTNAIASSGAHSTTFTGPRQDGFLVKFNAAGQREWGTYFEPNIEHEEVSGDQSWPHISLALHPDGQSVFVANTCQGSTASGDDGDIAVARFNQFGTLLWKRYLRGEFIDRCSGVATDPAGNVFISGWTRSATGIATPGAFRTTRSGNVSDAFLAKYREDGTLLWSTYFGGEGFDRPCDITADAAGNVVVAGVTMSDTGIATPGAHQTLKAPGLPAISGSRSDAFIVKFDGSGQRLWGTYYGVAGEENWFGIANDNQDNIYVVGQSQASSGLATPGAYRTTNTGGVFLVKFDAGGVRDWCTYFSGANRLRLDAITVAASGNIYLGGTSYGFSGIGTPGTHMPTQRSYQDAVMAKFDASGQLEWATYFGGEHHDRITGVTVDATEMLYFVGWTGSTEGIATKSAYQPVLDGTYDAFFNNIRSDGIICDSSTMRRNPDDTLVCEGESASFDLLAEGPLLTYQWQVDSGAGFVNVPAGFPYTGDDSPFLSIFPVSRSQSGYRYRCIILDECNKVLKSDSVTLTVIPSPSVFVIPSGSTTFCKSGSVTLTASVDPPCTFIWQKDGVDIPGETGPSYTARTQGKYRVIATNPYHCSDTSNVITITINPGPGAELSAEGPTTFCPGESVLLKVTTTRGTDFRWLRNDVDLPHANLPYFTASQSGLYRVIVSDDDSCTDSSATVLVTVLSGPGAAISASGPTAFCRGDSVLLSANQGAELTYRWQRNGTDIAGAWQRTFMARLAGAYRVIVTNAEGCPDTSAVITVSIGPQADVALSGPTSLCAGDTLILRTESGPGYTYRWERDDAHLSQATSASLAVASAGAYRVIVTNAIGCRDTSDVILVELYPSPEVDAGPAVSVCRGDSVQVGRPPSGDASTLTYLWTPAEGLSATDIPQPFAMPDATTRYILSVTAANGCVGRDTVTVTVHVPPEAVVTADGATTFCSGDSVLLSATPGFTSYRWSPYGETAESIVVTRSGTYAVEIVDENGCRGNSAPLEVTVHPSPEVIIAGPTQVCRNTQAWYFVDDQPDVAFDWSVEGGSILSGDGTESIRVQWGETGPAVVRVHARHLVSGCTVADDRVVEILDALRPRILPDPPVLCAGETLELDAGQGYANYAWSTGESSRRIVIDAAGRYSVAVNDGTGCEGADTVDVIELPPPLPVVEATGPTEFCAGESVILRSQLSYVTYRWARDGVPTGDTLRSVTARASGLYSVEVMDVNGCRGVSAPLQILVHPRFEVRVTGPTQVCVDGVAEYLAFPEGAYSYEWTVTGGVIESGEGTRTPRIRWSRTGTTSLRLRVVDTSSGCTDTTSMTVTITDGYSPQVRIGGDTVFCEGGSVLLEADGGFEQYEWSTGERTQSILVTQSGLYRVHVSDSLCSGWSVPVRVIVHPAPTPLVTPLGPTEICEGDSVLLQADAGYIRYQWWKDGSALADTGTVITARTTGSYHVSVTDARGCEGVSSPVAVIVHPVVRPEIMQDGLMLTASIGRSWQWLLDDTVLSGAVTQTIRAPRAGTYIVRIIDEHGCRAESDPVVIQLAPAACTLALPDLLARPGDHVSIPIVLESEERLDLAGAGTVSFDLVFARSVLHPLSGTFTDSEGQRRLRVAGVRVPSGEAVATVEALALLGSVEETSLMLENVEWDAG